MRAILIALFLLLGTVWLWRIGAIDPWVATQLENGYVASLLFFSAAGLMLVSGWLNELEAQKAAG
ncbi:hypothetical protein JNW90_13270 [Micromonospora sp. STR1s_5]|nr:hypothetical protein [Micromonospora sp. STR1s_5]